MKLEITKKNSEKGLMYFLIWSYKGFILLYQLGVIVTSVQISREVVTLGSLLGLIFNSTVFTCISLLEWKSILNTYNRKRRNRHHANIPLTYL